MKGYLYKSQFINSDGLNVHCRVAGPEDGFPVLFIHGLSGFSRDWDLLDLPEGLRIMAMDLPGFGDSEETADHSYPLELMLNSMVNVLNHFAKKPALVVAHSRGARQALGLPGKASNLVRALFLIDGAPTVPAEGRLQTAKNIAGTPHQFSSIEEAVELFRPRYPAYTEEQILERMRHYLRKTKEGLYEIKRDLIYKEEFQKVLDGKAQTESGPNWWEIYQSVQVPVYFVAANRSKMVNEEILDRLITLKPEIKLFKVDSGHNVPAENPSELSKLLRQVISEMIQ